MIRRAIFVCTLVAMSASLAAAAEFRVDSRVFLATERTPFVETTTLVQGDRVYDFLAEPEEVTIYSASAGQFFVLDAVRGIRADVPTSQIAQFKQQLKERTAESRQPLLRFLAAPRFDETWDEASGRLRLGSKWVRYAVRTEAWEDAEALQAYQRYSDWQVQFNALMNPGGLPPFARLELNKSLAARRRFSTHVELFVDRSDLEAENVQLRAEHAAFWRLTEADQARIEQAEARLASFHPVTVTEYRKAHEAQARRTK